MTGIVIFLGILLVIFVVAAVVLISLILSISRKISHNQQNIQTAQKNINDITDFVSTASSLAAMIGTAAGFVQNLRTKVHKRRDSDVKKRQKNR